MKSWINKYCYFYVLIITVTPANTKQVSSKYTPLIIHSKEQSHYNLSEEAILLLPGVTASLQSGKTRIRPTRTEHTRMQPVLYQCDLPNSAK